MDSADRRTDEVDSNHLEAAKESARWPLSNPGLNPVDADWKPLFLLYRLSPLFFLCIPFCFFDFVFDLEQCRASYTTWPTHCDYLPIYILLSKLALSIPFVVFDPFVDC